MRFKLRSVSGPVALLTTFNLVDAFQRPFAPRYPRLRRYNVDPLSISTSGFSNGAAISVQLLFVYSSIFRAAGIFSGVPYPVGEVGWKGDLPGMLKSHKLYPYIERWSAEGAIDPVEYMRGQRVLTYHGKKDIILPKIWQYMINDELRRYGTVVKSEVQTMVAGHCQPTDNFPANGDYLPIVGSIGFICNTGYQGVNHMFTHFWGNGFIWPARNNATPTGQLSKFDQNEFFDDDFAEGNGFNGAGFIYVPRACQWGKVRCRLHFAFHSILVQLSSRLFTDGYSDFVHHSGYMQAADANNIVVVFPEATPQNIPAFDVWGWWPTITRGGGKGKGMDKGKKKGGIQNNSYFRNGTHNLAIRRMVARIVNGI